MPYNARQTYRIHGAGGTLVEVGNFTLVAGTAALNSALSVITNAAFVKIGTAPGTENIALNYVMGTTTTHLTVNGTVLIVSNGTTDTTTYLSTLYGF